MKIFIRISYIYLEQIENGLVEAVAVLITQMPRLRPDVSAKKLGVCYNTKSEFMKVIYGVLVTYCIF